MTALREAFLELPECLHGDGEFFGPVDALRAYQVTASGPTPLALVRDDSINWVRIQGELVTPSDRRRRRESRRC